MSELHTYKTCSTDQANSKLRRSAKTDAPDDLADAAGTAVSGLPAERISLLRH